MHILSSATDNYPSLISGRRNEVCGRTGLSNPGPLALESDALLTALQGPANKKCRSGLELHCFVLSKS